jgi:DNA-binding transcriptional MerR regulator
MRVSELSERSGVPVPTIKYYVREGLLPAGERVAGRLSEYDEQHLRRLRLLRALREVGGVPVARLQDVVAVVESTSSVHTMMGAAADALAAEPAESDEPDEQSRRLADEIIARAGWDHVRPHARERHNLAALLHTAARHGTHLDPGAVDRYAQVADDVARHEIAALADRGEDDTVLERMVVGTVVYGELLTLLRRLAEEHHSHRRFATSEDG